MKTIEEMKADKRQLELAILSQVQEFEGICGVEVGGIDLFKNHTIGCSQGKTASVKVEVKI